jgi:hypothetical protein
MNHFQRIIKITGIILGIISIGLLFYSLSICLRIFGNLSNVKMVLFPFISYIIAFITQPLIMIEYEPISILFVIIQIIVPIFTLMIAKYKGRNWLFWVLLSILLPYTIIIIAFIPINSKKADEQIALSGNVWCVSRNRRIVLIVTDVPEGEYVGLQLYEKVVDVENGLYVSEDYSSSKEELLPLITQGQVKRMTWAELQQM